MSHLLVLAEAAKPDKTAFYIGGGLLAAWAVLVGFIGVTRPAFPNGEAGGRVVMAISVVLALGAMATAVITA